MERPQITQRVLDIIADLLDAQDEKGIAKYGKTIDDAEDYDWNVMAMEEMADGLKYLVKRIVQLERVNKQLAEMVERDAAEYESEVKRLLAHIAVLTEK